MIYQYQQSPGPKEPKADETDPSVENFNDGDATQVLNTADDAFDETAQTTPSASTVAGEEKVLPPGTGEVLDDGEQPILNQDDTTL